MNMMISNISDKLYEKKSNKMPVRKKMKSFLQHMDEFTKPQQKYAGTGENCNIAIPVIFIQ